MIDRRSPIAAFGTPLTAAAKTRSRVLLRSAVPSAREVAATAIPASLGIVVDFNAPDGD